MPAITRGTVYKKACFHFKTIIVLITPLFIAAAIRSPAPVEPGKHKVVFFSDRGVSLLTARVLQNHGFQVAVHTKPIRPSHLDPRWEKVFVLQREISSPGNLETITWLDDDLMPDMYWLRRLVTNKYYTPVYAGFEYGRRGPRRGAVMSNLMVFRTVTVAQDLVNKWAEAHVRYFNKTTGVQDQDGLNEIIRCNIPPLSCITHSFAAVHTSGKSEMRTRVLDRAAREHLWVHQRVLPKAFVYSIFGVLLVRALEFGRTPRWTGAIYNAFDVASHRMELIMGVLISLWLVLDSLPALDDIGRRPDLDCNGPGRVRRLGESSLALAGRWVSAHGALTYADWMNRHEVACVKGVWSTSKQNLVIWGMENKASLLMKLATTCSVLAGGFVGACLRVRDCHMQPSLRDWCEQRKQKA